MLKEVKNNVYNALFVAADEEGRRYAAFESDWNGEYWEATAATESGELIKGETVKLYPVMVYLPESDQYEEVGYDEEAPRVSLKSLKRNIKTFRILSPKIGYTERRKNNEKKTIAQHQN